MLCMAPVPQNLPVNVIDHSLFFHLFFLMNRECCMILNASCASGGDHHRFRFYLRFRSHHQYHFRACHCRQMRQFTCRSRHLICSSAQGAAASFDTVPPLTRTSPSWRSSRVYSHFPAAVHGKRTTLEFSKAAGHVPGLPRATK